jgi:hypothetical protein
MEIKKFSQNRSQSIYIHKRRRGESHHSDKIAYKGQSGQWPTTSALYLSMERDVIIGAARGFT